MRSAVVVPIFFLFASLSHAQTPAVGGVAPSARLNDHTGAAIEVPVDGSWTVLAFYPRSATPG